MNLASVFYYWFLNTVKYLKEKNGYILKSGFIFFILSVDTD